MSNVRPRTRQMPRTPDPSTQSLLASLERKVAAYCSFSVGRGNVSRTQGLAEYAAQLQSEGDRKTLTALAKEIDVWLREVHSPAEALSAMQVMLALGVRNSELPVAPSRRSLATILRRKSIKNQLEAGIVQAVLMNPELAGVLKVPLDELGALYDAWHVKNAVSLEPPTEA